MWIPCLDLETLSVFQWWTKNKNAVWSERLSLSLSGSSVYSNTKGAFFVVAIRYQHLKLCLCPILLCNTLCNGCIAVQSFCICNILNFHDSVGMYVCQLHWLVNVAQRFILKHLHKLAHLLDSQIFIFANCSSPFLCLIVTSFCYCTTLLAVSAIVNVVLGFSSANQTAVGVVENCVVSIYFFSPSSFVPIVSAVSSPSVKHAVSSFSLDAMDCNFGLACVVIVSQIRAVTTFHLFFQALSVVRYSMYHISCYQC